MQSNELTINNIEEMNLCITLNYTAVQDGIDSMKYCKAHGLAATLENLKGMQENIPAEGGCYSNDMRKACNLAVLALDTALYSRKKVDFYEWLEYASVQLENVAYALKKYNKVKAVEEASAIKGPWKDNGYSLLPTEAQLHHTLCNDTFALVSAHRTERTRGENYEAESMLYKQLKEAGYKVTSVLGCYGGVIEWSFLVRGEGLTAKAICRLGKEYQQESIIFSEEGNQRLIYCTAKDWGKTHYGTGFVHGDEVQASNCSSILDASEELNNRFSLNFDFSYSLPSSDIGLCPLTEKEQEQQERSDFIEEMQGYTLSIAAGSTPDCTSAALTQLYERYGVQRVDAFLSAFCKVKATSWHDRIASIS